ncbi:MAG: hypothetical protein CL908_22680 [Deltaproteobacteria bacterium]|nr:hypothetical protein [Deltaproteobacteria bacterium]
MSKCLLTLIATPELEDRLIDWLLGSGHAGFTTSSGRGHGIHAARLSAAEQVAGVQQRVIFWLQTDREEAGAVVDRLAEHFGGAGIHYWITPVSEAGPVGSR